ncbi:MAG: hypothetical protein AABX11_03755 [Nanoarchaeota archaeon]
MAVDVSGVSYFLPIFGFLIVFIISFVVMAKAKISETVWIQVLVSLLIATMFVSFAGARQYLENVVPWFAVVLVSMFLLLLLTGLFGKFSDGVMKGSGMFFLIVLFLIFIVSAFLVFSSYISPFIPWSESYQSTAGSSNFTEWIGTPRIGGAVILVIVSILVSWILVSVKK